MRTLHHSQGKSLTHGSAHTAATEKLLLASSTQCLDREGRLRRGVEENGTEVELMFQPSLSSCCVSLLSGWDDGSILFHSGLPKPWQHKGDFVGAHCVPARTTTGLM